MNREDFLNARTLHTLNQCEKCHKYLKFVERYNLNLEKKDWIDVIDWTRYVKFGIIDDPRIVEWLPYVEGGFPVLFFKGFRIDGVHTSEELEPTIKTLLLPDFKIEETNPQIFTEDCRFEKIPLIGRTVVCGEE